MLDLVSRMGRGGSGSLGRMALVVRRLDTLDDGFPELGRRLVSVQRTLGDSEERRLCGDGDEGLGGGEPLEQLELRRPEYVCGYGRARQAAAEVGLSDS